MKRILLIGATSKIAQETARLFASEGAKLYLVARNKEKLDAVAQDLAVRGASLVETAIVDATEYHRHRDIIDRALEVLGAIDLALVAHGTLPDQRACERSFASLQDTYCDNAIGALSWLTHLANVFEAQGHGTIAAISSVAGDRGRQSNYVYGSAKAALSVFLQGIRNRLAPHNIHVLTIKPGFVDTPMTEAFEKNALWSSPERVAGDIRRAIRAHTEVLYTPWFWRYVMLVLRLVPERFFKRTRL